MKRFISLTIAAAFVLYAGAQKVSANLKFTKGQQIQVQSQTKALGSQEAMGQTIEMNVTNDFTQVFEVVDATPQQTTLKLITRRVASSMEGMGQSMTMDSDKKEDLDGQMGPFLKDLLAKKYELVISNTGKIVASKEVTDSSATTAEGSEQVASAMSAMGMGSAAPETGENSVFFTLPAKEVQKGDSWTDTSVVKGGREIGTYTIDEITPTEILINYTGTSTTNMKGEMMGMEMVTNLNNKITARITVDKASGLLKEKNLTTDSEGTVDVMGQSIPVTNKSTTLITVKM